MMSSEPVKALTIGGSDSGGAAGIQADLKTWTALGVYGMSALTAVTAQNSVAVTAVHYLSPEFITAQITAVLSDYGAQALKTGFLGRVEIITTVAEQLRAWQDVPRVIDPVLVNHQGQAMFGVAVVAAYAAHLLPLASLITPNWREAALLAGLPPDELLQETGLRTAIATLHSFGAAAVLVTGLPQGDQIVDIWSDGGDVVSLSYDRIATDNRHGSGDTLSAAICAFMARGLSLEDAVAPARAFTRTAIAGAANWHPGAGHGPLAHFAAPGT